MEPEKIFNEILNGTLRKDRGCEKLRVISYKSNDPEVQLKIIKMFEEIEGNEILKL